MLSEDIKNVRAALGVLAGQVGADQWAMLKIARDNLMACADQAEELETTILPVRQVVQEVGK